MITRSKLVEQLRDYQIRSQHKCPALVIFSPKPIISTWVDVAVAVFWAVLFAVLLISSYLSLYFRYCWLSFAIICLCIFLPIQLRISRQAIARKRDRRNFEPLNHQSKDCFVLKRSKQPQEAMPLVVPLRALVEIGKEDIMAEP